MRTFILSLLSSTPIKRKEILRQCQEQGFDTTERAVRKAIEELIEVSHILIQSSEKGYSLIENEKDFADAVEYLEAKAKSIAVRKNTLVMLWNKKKENEADKKQLELFQ